MPIHAQLEPHSRAVHRDGACLETDFITVSDSTQSRHAAGLHRVRLSLVLCGFLSMLVTLGCSPATAPIAPTTPPINPLAPFSLTVGMSVGLGADAGRAEITAKVQGPTGAPLGNVPVVFATDTGTLSADQVTTADSGVASTTLTASSSAHVTATAGTLSSRLLVPAQPPLSAPPTSTTTTPAGPPSSDPGSLSASLDATSALTGASVLMTVNVRNAVMPASYLWSFGDDASFRGLSASTAHIYAAAGSYPVTVTVTDAAGRSTAASSTATITDPVVTTPPPPPASYTVTLTAAPASVVAGNGSVLTASATPQNGAPAPSSYDWDCNGDGTKETTTSAPTNFTTCTYSTPGTITSTVTVNGTGATGSASTTVSVSAAAPLTVAIVPASFSPALGVPVNFVATVTSAGALPATFQWEWDENGDGTYEVTIPNTDPTAGNPHTHSITFGAIGVKTVKVRVTDTATARTAVGGPVEVTVH
jgi:PKD repeat protein